MKKIDINIKNIAHSSTGFSDTIKISSKIHSPDSKIYNFERPISGTIKFTNLDKQIAGKFSLSVLTKFICFRCNKYFSKKIIINFSRNYELSQIDNKKNIDVLPDINEEIILTVPVKPLCNINCKGICQNCGQNLNDKKCHCQIKQINIKPFSKLKELLEKDKNG